TPWPPDQDLPLVLNYQCGVVKRSQLNEGKPRLCSPLLYRPYPTLHDLTRFLITPSESACSPVHAAVFGGWASVYRIALFQRFLGSDGRGGRGLIGHGQSVRAGRAWKPALLERDGWCTICA